MKTIRFGIVGLGLMGREIASAVARWCHLEDLDVRPEITAICDSSPPPGRVGWFNSNFPSIRQFTTDYRELVANPEVDAVYCAVPHHLHAGLYTAIIRGGKHLLGEKPFGIDQAANTAILAVLRDVPGLVVRSSSEFPFFPAVQRLFEMVEKGAFGRIIEANTGFLHSSDLDPNKPINWKRLIRTNGEYGVMGDLGLHACHFPFRVGWQPRNVRAVLSKIVAQRPDGKGGMMPCETWDNATLLCEAEDREGTRFPWTLKTQRLAPGRRLCHTGGNRHEPSSFHRRVAFAGRRHHRGRLSQVHENEHPARTWSPSLRGGRQGRRGALRVCGCATSNPRGGAPRLHQCGGQQ